MRARKSRSQWSAIIRAFERSGGSHEEFCSKRGLEVGTFRSWLYRLRKREAPVEIALVPVEVTEASAPHPVAAAGVASELVIVVAGVEVRVGVGTDAGYVASLVAELRSRC